MSTNEPGQPTQPDLAASDGGKPKPPPIRIEPPEGTEEMGGEQPCQAHRFWDLEDEGR